MEGQTESQAEIADAPAPATTMDWDADDLGTKLATECTNGVSAMDTP